MAIDMPPMTLEEAQRIYDRPAYVSSIEDTKGAGLGLGASSRALALADTALGVGVKAGLGWQLTNIKRAVARRERDLDTVYDFGNYLIHDRVVPPVITEAKDIYSQEGDYALRLSGALYAIEAQARFSSVAPNWRGYLSFPSVEVRRNDLVQALLPRDDQEQRVWEEAVTEGWKQGVEQANLMLEHGFDRMNRDLLGMVRFHTFVLQGRISMPAIASESIPVTKANDSMAVDETLLRITTLPEFNAHIHSWGAAIVDSAVPATPEGPALGGDR